jgi:hypothetical protein
MVVDVKRVDERSVVCASGIGGRERCTIKTADTSECRLYQAQS